MNFSLQPLRIPTGWSVVYNTFSDVAPTPDLGDDACLWFTEDLLQLTCERRGRLLDLGWYPDGDIAEGAYRIMVLAGDFHGRCLHSFESRERTLVVAEIERLLFEIVEGRL